MNNRFNESKIFQTFTIPGQVRGDERRMKIIKATVDSLAKYGLHDTTFDSIGKIAGMKRSHMIYYYKNYDELIFAAIQYGVACGQMVTIELVQEAQNPREKILAMVSGLFEQARRYPKNAVIFSLLWHLASFDRKYRALQNESRQMGTLRLETFLKEHFGAETGHEKLRELCKRIQASTFGFWLEAMTTYSYLNLEEAEKAAVHNAADLLDHFEK